MSAKPPPLPSETPSPAAAKAPRRRGAIDTLIVRDQTAVFWFLVACAVAAACAWYLVIMAEALKARPPFVVMDQAGAYYVTPGLNYDSNVKPNVNPLHSHLTTLAVETLFQRGPEGLVHENRVGKLFTKNGTTALRGILKKEDAYFASQQVEQTLTLDNAPLIRAILPTAASTQAEGTVTRRSVFKGQPRIETYHFKVVFVWTMNPDMRRIPAFPSVVEKITQYELEKISDS